MAAPLFDVRDALIGEIGERSAQDVLTALKGWLRDGTVVFAHLERAAGIPLLRGAALLLIGDGEVKARRMLGRFAGLASTHLAFQAVQHPPTDVATLASVDAGSGAGWAVVRAAPRLVGSSGWPALGTELGGLGPASNASATAPPCGTTAASSPPASARPPTSRPSAPCAAPPPRRAPRSPSTPSTAAPPPPSTASRN